MGVIVVGTGGSLDSGSMAGCCTPSGYRKIFGEKTARRDVRKYRRRGLDRAARQIVGFLAGRGVDGDSVLEVGGGVGAIQLELLKAGAARATNVELSPEYEPYAAELLGGDERVARRRLVLSFPPDTALFRAGSAVLNAFLALTRTEFRTFVHPAAAILAPARAHGLEPALDTRTRMWRIVGFERRST